MSNNEAEVPTMASVQQWLIDEVNNKYSDLDKSLKDALSSDLWYDVECLGGPAAENTIARTLQFWRCLSESENKDPGQNESMSDMMLFMDGKAHQSLIDFRVNAIKVYQDYLPTLPDPKSGLSAEDEAAATKAAQGKAVAALFGDSVLDQEMPWEAVLKSLQICERLHRVTDAHGEGMIWLVPLDPAHSPGVQPNLTDDQFDLYLELIRRRWPDMRDTAAVAKATLDGFHKDEKPPARTTDEKQPPEQKLYVVYEPPHTAGSA